MGKATVDDKAALGRELTAVAMATDERAKLAGEIATISGRLQALADRIATDSYLQSKLRRSGSPTPEISIEAFRHAATCGLDLARHLVQPSSPPPAAPTDTCGAGIGWCHEND